ncbi:MAG: YicC family protein [Candidatus Aegiribacteria sp.]|nr:YicC family protein [Candidatus Aegiribacteria sp.]
MYNILLAATGAVFTLEGHLMESMTGFGSATVRRNGFSVTIEAKSVNHKALSPTIRLPDVLWNQEPVAWKATGKLFERGRIKINVRIDIEGEDAVLPSINIDAAEKYIKAAKNLSKDLDCKGEVSAGVLFGLPGVVLMTDPSGLDSEELSSAFLECMDKALKALKENRMREGNALAPVFRDGFRAIRSLADPILQEQKENVQERFLKLKERITILLDDVRLDENRLMQELAVLADRSDVSEEVQRLQCHLDHAGEILDSDESSPGRRLGFLIQEMHREINTMGSKVDNADLSLSIIEMKNILSSLKEQVLNIE